MKELPPELEEEFENEEWSKPYTDIDEMFRDLGLTETKVYIGDIELPVQPPTFTFKKE